jgi:hypothetical protein
MRTDIEVMFEINENAYAIMQSLETKKISQLEALDILTVALILSAQRADMNKKDFINHTSEMWDFLKEAEEDHKQSGKYTH